MRALRELRDGPPRTPHESYERGLHTHPEYDPSASEAASLLYPDREVLLPPRSAQTAHRIHPEHDPERSEAGSLLYPDRLLCTPTPASSKPNVPMKREIRVRTLMRYEQCEAGALIYPNRAPAPDCSNAPLKRESLALTPNQIDQGALTGAVALARARRLAQQAPSLPARVARRQWELPPRAGMNEPIHPRCPRSLQRAEASAAGNAHPPGVLDAPSAAVVPAAMPPPGPPASTSAEAAQEITALRMQVAGLTQLLQQGVVVPLAAVANGATADAGTLDGARAVRVWFDASPGADLPAWRWTFGTQPHERSPRSDDLSTAPCCR